MSFRLRFTRVAQPTCLCAIVAAAGVASCSSTSGNGPANQDSGPSTGTGSGSGTGAGTGTGSGSGKSDAGKTPGDSGSSQDTGVDSGTGTGSGTADSGHDAGMLAGDGGSVCAAASGAVAWMGTIASSVSALSLTDIVVAPNNDVIVSDLSANATYEQHRWDKSGTVLSNHQDPLGAYTGRFWPSPLFTASDNGVFYGMLMTGKVTGTNSEVSLNFAKIAADGTAVFDTPTTATMPTSAGSPTVTMFDTGGDSGGGLHGPLVMTGPQYFAPGVYCWSGTGADEGPSAGTVTGMMKGHSFEWPTSDTSLAFATPVTENINFGCGSVTVPAAGGIVIGSAGGGSGCNWNKLLALPTASVVDYEFRAGADSSTALAVVYTGTINFGGTAMTSTGTSSLAVAHFSSTGALLWASSFGGAGSKFTLGDVDVNSAGVLMLSAGYSGTVEMGGSALPSSDNTFVAVFDAAGTFKWVKPVTVTAPGQLRANLGTCGVDVATNSPSVDFGTGALSTVHSPDAASIGVAALGL